MHHRSALVSLPFVLALATACGGDSNANPNAPSVTPSAPAVFQAGRYEMLISGGTLAGSCTGGTASPGSVNPGAAHVGTVELRAENGDWIARSTGADDTLRIRFRFDAFPASRAFTGSVTGRAASITGTAGQGLPALEAANGAFLSGSALDEEQGLGAVEVFGTIAGQLVFTGGRGVVTCTGGNLILTRASGL